MQTQHMLWTFYVSCLSVCHTPEPCLLLPGTPPLPIILVLCCQTSPRKLRRSHTGIRKIRD